MCRGILNVISGEKTGYRINGWHSDKTVLLVLQIQVWDEGERIQENANGSEDSPAVFIPSDDRTNACT